MEAAKADAQRIATSIHNGELEVLKLTNADRSAYARATEFLGPFGKSLDMAAQEYAEAAEILAGKTSLVEAARFFVKHHPVRLPDRTIPEVSKEMIAAKKADGMSERYLADLTSRLDRFGQTFKGQITAASTAEVQDWLHSMNLAHRGRNNYRAVVVALFNFAKSRGYLAKNQPSEADGLTKVKGAESQIGIFIPEEMTLLLSHADASLVPFYAIGAFAGLRTAEIQRLEWDEVKIDGMRQLRR